MSLSEKWKAFISTADEKLTPIERHIAQSAFFAGAEAMENISSYDEQIHALAEIRQFKLGALASTSAPEGTGNDVPRGTFGN